MIDDRSVAVADAEAVVVAEADDLVAGLVGAFVDLEDRSPQLAVRLAVTAGSAVEVIDVAAADGDHRHVDALLAPLEPVIGHRLVDLDGVGAGDQATVRLEGVEPPVDVSTAQVLERGPLPRVDLAAVLAERHGVEESV